MNHNSNRASSSPLPISGEPQQAAATWSSPGIEQPLVAAAAIARSQQQPPESAEYYDDEYYDEEEEEPGPVVPSARPVIPPAAPAAPAAAPEPRQPKAEEHQSTVNPGNHYQAAGAGNDNGTLPLYDDSYYYDEDYEEEEPVPVSEEKAQPKDSAQGEEKRLEVRELCVCAWFTQGDYGSEDLSRRGSQRADWTRVSCAVNCRFVMG